MVSEKQTTIIKPDNWLDLVCSPETAGPDLEQCLSNYNVHKNH